MRGGILSNLSNYGMPERLYTRQEDGTSHKIHPDFKRQEVVFPHNFWAT